MADLIRTGLTQEEAERIAAEQIQLLQNGGIPQQGKTSLITFIDDPGKTNIYMILLTEVDDDGEVINQVWQEVIGRDEAFRTIVDDIDNIDLLSSYITIRKEEVENGELVINYVNRKSCYNYLRYLLDNELVENPMNIDPDDYINDIEDIEEGDEN